MPDQVGRETARSSAPTSGLDTSLFEAVTHNDLMDVLRAEQTAAVVQAAWRHGHDNCPDGPDAHEDFCLNGRQE